MKKNYDSAAPDIQWSLELFQWTAKNTQVRFFGDPILREPCEPVQPFDFGSGALKQIHDDLESTLSKYRKHSGIGRGLAANQIGYTKAVIAIWGHKGPEVMYSPKLIKAEGESSYWESCISSGTLLIGEVIRPRKCEFIYQDAEGEQKTLLADELQTRVLLHEIDHLNGITCDEKYEPRTMKLITGGKKEILNFQLKKLS